MRETSEQALDQGKSQIIKALEKNAPAGKVDLNNASSLTIKNYLMEKDPLRLGTDADSDTRRGAGIVDYRDKVRGGVLNSLDELRAAAIPRLSQASEDGFYLSDFGVRNVEIVGPQVGEQLRNQAVWRFFTRFWECWFTWGSDSSGFMVLRLWLRYSTTP